MSSWEPNHGAAQPVMYYSFVGLGAKGEWKMIKFFIGTLILSLSGAVTVFYVAPPSFWGGDHGKPTTGVVAAPEINSSSAIGALTLLLGSVVVLRSRVATKR
jgi:hypothetical protein